MFPIKNAVPTRYPPLVTRALITVNCAVFLFELSLSPGEVNRLLLRFALIPAQYFSPYSDTGLSPVDYLPFLTMMFLHGGWLHLILNMWTLWLFGPAVEDRMGHGRYFAFYLACGILASVTQVAASPSSTVPALGASGAIAGIMGCYVRLFPLARLLPAQLEDGQLREPHERLCDIDHPFFHVTGRAAFRCDSGERRHWASLM
jgi:membrane associated rhomboid family serine protease